MSKFIRSGSHRTKPEAIPTSSGVGRHEINLNKVLDICLLPYYNKGEDRERMVMKYLIRLKKKGYCSYCWIDNSQIVNVEMEIDDSIVDVKWHLYKTIKEKYPNLIFFGQYHKVYEKLPNGWRRLNGTLTAPNGYYWASNGKSFFDKNIERALIYEE